MSDTSVTEANTDTTDAASAEGDAGSRDPKTDDINPLTSEAASEEDKPIKDDVNPLTTEKADEGSEEEDKGGRDTEEEDKSGDGNGEQKAGAPEEYAEFTVPEGSVIDPKQLGGFHEIAKSMNLDQEQAQALINYESERLSKNAEASASSWERTINSWLNEAKADKDIGGENYDTTVEMGKRALAQFGTPELSSALDDLGIGNHPEIIRFMARVGMELSEDTTAGGDGPGGEPTLAQRLFPSHASAGS